MECPTCGGDYADLERHQKTHEAVTGFLDNIDGNVAERTAKTPPDQANPEVGP